MTWSGGAGQAEPGGAAGGRQQVWQEVLWWQIFLVSEMEKHIFAATNLQGRV